jgi:hypothetical protein
MFDVDCHRHGPRDAISDPSEAVRCLAPFT